MRSTSRWLAVATLGVLLAGAARGQDEIGVEGELERTASTTPQEKVVYAEETTSEVGEALREVNKLSEGAQREGEASKAECLATRLTALTALDEVSKAAATAMQAAIAAGEMERADHELRKLAVARSKSRQLLAEAQQCVSGAQALKAGETSVVVEGGVEETDESLEAVPYDPFDVGSDPPDTSPFL